MEKNASANGHRLLLALAIMLSIAGIGVRIWWVRRHADGSDLAQNRHVFHRRQMDFKSRCAEGVIGRRIEDVLPLFGGQESRDFRGTSYSWKAWPCELVVESGVVIGLFYHDFPFTMQPLPSDWRRTHALPYFERHPAFLDDAYAGRWDGKGGYVFERR